MIELTQTALAPIGNCWQTAIACILDLDPETMPSQALLDVPERTRSGWGSYQNVLNGYLGKHHGLQYAEIPDYALGAITVRDPGYHMLIGPTVRSEAHREAGRHQVNHVAVARYGEMVWDPHPSRAGLTVVERWGVLAPLLDRTREWRVEFARKIAADGRDDAEDFRRVFLDCLCPACSAPRGDQPGKELRP